MYSRTPPLPCDLLRKIHASVPSLPIADYPSASGLLDANTDVMVTGIISRKELNGQNAKILGVHENDRYMVRITLSGEQIRLKAENVLPVTGPLQASAEADDEDEDGDSEFDSEFDDGDDMGDDDE